MSKIVLVCLRAPDQSQIDAMRHSLREFLQSLRPEGLNDAPVTVVDDGRGLFLGVFNPVAATVHERSAYAGWLSQDREHWWRPGTTVPDGSFALFRSSDDRVEVFADCVATRTIWVAKTEEVVVASMSQRAIPWFLGGFEPRPEALAWMLSSGSLGPGLSWDRRAQLLGPGHSAHLDRRNWQLRVDTPAVAFRVDPVADAVH